MRINLPVLNGDLTALPKEMALEGGKGGKLEAEGALGGGGHWRKTSRGSQDCFVFTSWLVVAFVFLTDGPSDIAWDNKQEFVNYSSCLGAPQEDNCQ